MNNALYDFLSIIIIFVIIWWVYVFSEKKCALFDNYNQIIAQSYLKIKVNALNSRKYGVVFLNKNHQISILKV